MPALRWPDVGKHPVAWGLGLLLLAVIIALRLYLSVWLTEYVNARLHDMDGYRGSIRELHVDLTRSAYRIEGLKLTKMRGHFPVPFLVIREVDFSLHWGALLHGRIVSKVALTQPVINFAVDTTGTEKQTGAEIDWSRRIRDLMPIDINRVTFSDGRITYQDFSSHPRVNIDIHHVSGEAHNLRNVVDKRGALPSDIELRGDSIGGGALSLRGRMNILRDIPDFDVDAKLENMDLPAINDYTDAYASLDFNKGSLSVYSQLIVRDSALSGYIKPIATHVGVIDLKRQPNPAKLVWESVVSVIMEIFTNHTKDQFATKIEISGSLRNVRTDFWSTVAGIVRNAFVRAFDKKIDQDYRF